MLQEVDRTANYRPQAQDLQAERYGMGFPPIASRDIRRA